MTMQGAPPPPEFVPLKARPVLQERGQLFGLVLFLVSCFSLISMMAISLGGRLISDLVSKHQRGAPTIVVPERFMTFLVILQIVGLICIGATWTWKRWGLYGYFVCNALFIFLVFRILGKPPMLDIIAVVAMLFTAFPRMHMFE
jgi:hypothetical protein